MLQDQYWKELYQLRVHVKYIELYHEQAVNWQRGIAIFLALTSSGSVAGWLIWDNASVVWALIIGASQVVNIIKEFLPYEARVSSLPSLNHALDQLANAAEKDWSKVANGTLTATEVNNLWHEIKNKKTDYVHNLLKGGTLPEKQKIFKRAQESTAVYFSHFYSW